LLNSLLAAYFCLSGITIYLSFCHFLIGLTSTFDLSVFKLTFEKKNDFEIWHFVAVFSSLHEVLVWNIEWSDMISSFYFTWSHHFEVFNECPQQKKSLLNLIPTLKNLDLYDKPFVERKKIACFWFGRKLPDGFIFTIIILPKMSTKVAEIYFLCHFEMFPSFLHM